jgi:hypothetical protein
VRSAPALLALLGAAAGVAAACGDDPEPTFYLGAGGAPPPASAYGNPFVPNGGPAGAGGQAGAGGEGGAGGSRPARPLPASAATPCAGLPDGLPLPGADALAAVGSLGPGVPLTASFGGGAYRLAPDVTCPAGGVGGASAPPRETDLPPSTFGWAILPDGRRVAASAGGLALLPAAGSAPLATCPLPERPAGTRRRVAFDPNDARHAWVADGGAELHERRLVEGGTCQAPPPVALPDRAAIRDVAARPDEGRLWLAVIGSSGSEGALAQVRGARATAAGLVTEGEVSWPDRSGSCVAGGLLSADALAALPDGGVAVADGACAAVVAFDATLAPAFRVTLPPGNAPRAVAPAGGGGALFVATTTVSLDGARVGLWRATPPEPANGD